MPNILKLENKYNIYAICGTNSLNANETATQYSANIATINFDEILADNNVDLVMSCAPHGTSSRKIGRLGKCNFRYSVTIHGWLYPSIIAVCQRNKKCISRRINPMAISYRMNPGYIPLDFWVHKDGGRFIGDAYHIIDLFKFFTKSEIESVCVNRIAARTMSISSTDNVSVYVKYKDGSIANLIYAALGSTKYPSKPLTILFIK